MADFGVLHRNEVSGSLTGLTRVRKFCQDDAHIFCTHDQIQQEVKNTLDFIKKIYHIFGFEYKVFLSTRPTEFMGDIELWNEAEQSLTDALTENMIAFEVNDGDGAFYGSKIDIKLKDSIGREHQCATIQLDFQLPIRFGLEYKDANGDMQRPVIVHRAIFGSLERFFAIVIEHYQGKYPFWLSPRQVKIIPVSEKFTEYANTIHTLFKNNGLYVDIDDSNEQLKKKIRNAEVEQYSSIIVIGGNEESNNSVNIRGIGDKSLNDALHYYMDLNAIKDTPVAHQLCL